MSCNIEVRNQEATISVTSTDVSWWLRSWRMEINHIKENISFPQFCLYREIAERGRKEESCIDCVVQISGAWSRPSTVCITQSIKNLQDWRTLWKWGGWRLNESIFSIPHLFVVYLYDINHYGMLANCWLPHSSLNLSLDLNTPDIEMVLDTEKAFTEHWQML